MIVLVTGGASSGKSDWAERFAVQLASGQPACAPDAPDNRRGATGKLVYLATMQPFGEEGARRIERHRNMRAGKGFTTVEAQWSLENVHLDPDATVLLEDMGNLVANELFSEAEGLQEAKQVRDAVIAGIEAVASRCANLVAVTNEIGADGDDYAEETQVYRQILGACSCAVAARADIVVEVVFGLANVLKGERLLESSPSSESTIGGDGA